MNYSEPHRDALGALVVKALEPLDRPTEVLRGLFLDQGKRLEGLGDEVLAILFRRGVIDQTQITDAILTWKTLADSERDEEAIK